MNPQPVTVPVLPREWDRLVRAARRNEDVNMGERGPHMNDDNTLDEVCCRIASAIVATRPESDPDAAYSEGLAIVNEFARLDDDEREAFREAGGLTIGFGEPPEWLA